MPRICAPYGILNTALVNNLSAWELEYGALEQGDMIRGYRHYQSLVSPEWKSIKPRRSEADDWLSQSSGSTDTLQSQGNHELGNDPPCVRQYGMFPWLRSCKDCILTMRGAHHSDGCSISERHVSPATTM